MPDTPAVSELRLVVTTADYDAALRFYRDVLGLGQRAAFASPDGGQVAILEAGRATLELSNPRNAAYIDEVEVGRRVAGPIRVAFEVADSPAAARALEAAGATVIAAPTRTPWNSVNARLAAPADLQLTLFSGPADGADEAAALARDAADRQGLRIAELRELADLNEAAALLQAIWRADTPDQVVSADLMRALASSGNYVVGAFRGDKLVAATVAFFGAGHLHSHVTGVDPAAQRGGVGYALKQHQRAWALARRITEVRWTFDPLVRRNAYFNLHKLGALPVEYLTEFYGEMTDGINLGDASDRLYVGWQLGSPRAQAAAHGEPGDVDA
ncbi:MAG TPA: GNAT family N-acetyltransferase, partial [Micromonosporaceae bacterium]|nr:GNAT family N-acetyltransferase [Micromonosporaceae bacterium]